MSKVRDEHEGIRKDGWEPRLKSSVVNFFWGGCTTILAATGGYGIASCSLESTATH